MSFMRDQELAGLPGGKTIVSACADHGLPANVIPLPFQGVSNSVIAAKAAIQCFRYFAGDCGFRRNDDDGVFDLELE